jgi:hypothetical protein
MVTEAVRGFAAVTFIKELNIICEPHYKVAADTYGCEAESEG